MLLGLAEDGLRGVFDGGLDLGGGAHGGGAADRCSGHCIGVGGGGLVVCLVWSSEVEGCDCLVCS